MAELARLGLYVDSSGVVRATKELQKLERKGKGAERQSDKLKRSFGGLKTAAIAVGSAIAAIGVTRLIGNVADASIALDAMESSLRVATGSAEGAAAEFQFLREESERLGLDLRTSGDAFASLAAAARGTALEGQGARDIFVAVSEAMTALGRDSEATEGALRAIEQMISKGNVSAEELRGQLGERLPGAFQLAARAAGVTTQELDKMLRNGEVLAADLLPKLAVELSNAFSAEAERRANGLQAEINRFKTAVFDLMSSGNMASLANAIRDITTLIKDPAFQQGFGNFVGLILKIAEKGGQAAAFVGNLIPSQLEELNTRISQEQRLLEQLADEYNRPRLLRINPLVSSEEIGKKVDKQREKVAKLRKAYEQAAVAALPAFNPEGVMNTPDTGGGGGLTEDQIKAIEKARESLQGVSDDLRDQVGVFGLSESAAIRYRLSIGDLSGDVRLLGAEGMALSSQIIASADALEQLKISEEISDSFNELTQELQQQRSALQLTARELAIYEASSRLSIHATDDMRKQVEALAGKLYDEQQAMERSNQLRQEAKSVLDSIASPMERYSEQVALLSNLLRAGEIDQKEFNLAIKQAQEDLREATKGTTEDMTAFMKKAAENMQDAMSNTFFDFMQGEFDNLGDSFKNMLDRMVADALAAQLNNAIFPSSMGGIGGWFNSGGGGDYVSNSGFAPGGGSSGGFMDGLKSLVSFDGGGYTGDGSRSGGLDGKGGQLALLHPQETVIDHTKGQTINNGVTVNINVSGIRDGADLRRSASQVAQQAGAAANRALSRNG